MIKDNTVIKFILQYIFLCIVILGLVLILIGQFRFDTVLGIDVSKLIANTGAILFVTASLQWIYDSYVKKKFLQEIIEKATGSANIGMSGMRDVVQGSKEINIAHLIEKSEVLYLGKHWSVNTIKDNIESLKKRVKDSNKKTYFILLKENSEILKYIHSNDSPEICKTKIASTKSFILSQLKSDASSENIVLKEINQMLHYSFIASEDTIWICPCKNTKGHSSEMPHFEIHKGSFLFDHFNKDIHNLIESNNE